MNCLTESYICLIWFDNGVFLFRVFRESFRTEPLSFMEWLWLQLVQGYTVSPLLQIIVRIPSIDWECLCSFTLTYNILEALNPPLCSFAVRSIHKEALFLNVISCD